MRGARAVVGAALVAAGVIGARAANAQAAFTGVITFRSYGSGGKVETLTQTMRGHRVRFDMGSGADAGAKAKGAWMIDGDSHTTTILIPERKQYMQFTAEDIKRNADRMAASPGAAAMRARLDSATKNGKLDVTKTGRTETVAGVKCDVYHVVGVSRGKKKEGEFCVADGVGFALLDMAVGGGGMGAMGGNPAAGIPEIAALRDVLKGNRGILKITEIENGQSVTKLEAIKIDRATPSDAAFAIPAGFTKFEMPAFPTRPPTR